MTEERSVAYLADRIQMLLHDFKQPGLSPESKRVIMDAVCERAERIVRATQKAPAKQPEARVRYRSLEVPGRLVQIDGCDDRLVLSFETIAAHDFMTRARKLLPPFKGSYIKK